MLSQREVGEIVYDSQLSENLASLGRKLGYAPRELRKTLIKENPNSDEGRTSAAIEIQRTWRGYLSRANLYSLVEPGASKTAVYSGSKHIIMRQDDFTGDDESGKKESAARMKLEESYKEYVRHLMSAPEIPARMPTLDVFCACLIQSWWRSVLQQKQKSGQLQREQPLARPSHLLIQTRPRRLYSVQEAASIIQRAWRRHIDIQVYRYYRDLISFKTRGNPGLMLRCINPQEAKLLDPAAGIHIKFRLAGERFPPNIYYKIFTHRPIQDMCANSPKNYTVANVKLKMAKDQHNRGRQEVGGPKDRNSSWYQRTDNNGWRLVSDRLIHHIMADPITWETSQKKYEYHHDKLQRKQDVEKKKKQRKIQWMQKMYRDGMLKAKSDDKETIQLIEGAAAGSNTPAPRPPDNTQSMVATVDNYGPDALEDWEVDELLDWTTSLNFEDYQNGWKELATSANSEKQVAVKQPSTSVWNRMFTATDTTQEDKMRLFTSTADPYEFSLSTGPSRYQSTQQSRNTPVSSTGSVAKAQAVS